MRTTRVACALTLTIAALLLSGCAAAEDAVRGTAESAASRVASKAAEIPMNIARDQLCKVVEDGKISAAERRRLTDAIDSAERAGLPPELTDAARRLATDNSANSRKALKRLQRQCKA